MLSRALTLELLPKRRDAPRGHAYGSPAAIRGRAATNAARGKLTIMRRAALVLATARLIQGEYVGGVPSNWHASRHFAKLVEYQSISNLTFGLRAAGPTRDEHWRPYWTKHKFATQSRVEPKRRQRRAPPAATNEDA